MFFCLPRIDWKEAAQALDEEPGSGKTVFGFPLEQVEDEIVKRFTNIWIEVNRWGRVVEQAVLHDHHGVLAFSRNLTCEQTVEDQSKGI